MNAIRTFSVAAVAALAAFGAQAQSAGDVYGQGFAQEAQSTLSRAAVQSEARQAIKNYAFPSAVQPSKLENKAQSLKSRDQVRQEAAEAVKAGSTDIGYLG